MFHLVYTSYAVNPFSEDELISLLKQSRAFNKDHDITGMLLYIQGKFMQVLEGKKDEVIQLYERIRKDPRHRRVSAIVEGNSPDRIFKDWSMGFKQLSDQEARGLSNFQDLDSFFSDRGPSADTSLLMVFLKLFYTKNMVDYVEG